MIVRNEYLKRLIDFKDKKLIKVVTGIRRCGKSTLLQMYQEYLIKTGVSQEQIISINFENPDFDNFRDYKSLYNYLKSKILPDKKIYIFLDEIQNVEEYQRAVDGLFIINNVDVYITGSNAYFMSGELATLLSGRYIEIQMLPLSFKEYISAFDKKNDLQSLYRQYIERSGFPYTTELDNEEQIRAYLGGIYNTVLLKDIVGRKNISNVSLLESIIKFVFDNIGNITSPKKISDTMVSKGRKISNHTVENYLSILVESLMLYKANRYDIKGKQYLETQEKYYVADIGLRYFLLGSKYVDFGHILENVIYLELIRRGYKVYIGKFNTLEVDFVTEKGGELQYYQVAQTVMEKDTLDRELKPLKLIKDNYAKFLITMDNLPNVSHNGIKQIYALDWLLE
ncbi:ATP-binding protein [bacterium]|nr:ATP-binding protein [bacterium]